jgi:DNA-binding NtrC family response regulator
MLDRSIDPRIRFNCAIKVDTGRGFQWIISGGLARTGILENNSQINILTIDDESYIRQSVRTYLEDYGFHVYEAENGRVGLEVFEKESIDLVLLDLRMPEMDGLQVLEILKEKAPETPLVVASGTGNITAVVDALHLGAWDYILKPIEDMSVLYHSVKKCFKTEPA